MTDVGVIDIYWQVHGPSDVRNVQLEITIPSANLNKRIMNVDIRNGDFDRVVEAVDRSKRWAASRKLSISYDQPAFDRAMNDTRKYMMFTVNVCK